MKTAELRSIATRLSKNKYVLLVLVLGLLLMLLPGARGGRQTDEKSDSLPSSGISLIAESERIAEMLCSIDGVGRASVLISARGAVVVCDGADKASVRLDVTQAVMVYSGLGSDRIAVCKMK